MLDARPESGKAKEKLAGGETKEERIIIPVCWGGAQRAMGTKTEKTGHRKTGTT